MNTTKKAIAYVRVANKNQERPSASFEGQLKTIQEYAKRNNIEIESVYKSVGSDKRTASGVLDILRDCYFNKRAIDYLLVSRIDRLTRNLDSFHLYKSMAKEIGLIIRPVTPELENPESPLGAFLETMAVCLSEYDHHRRSEMVKAGIRRRKAEQK